MTIRFAARLCNAPPEETLDLALFEAAFCFSCHEIRMRGTAVPPALTTQFFDADSAGSGPPHPLPCGDALNP
jgi:hypothetical protein